VPTARLYLLLRTESGFLWEATSRDGLKWDGLKQTTIQSVTCCPQMARLADGRIALLWNAPPRHDPKSGSSRVELSLAFSSDETATWSKPVIVAANYVPGGRVSYPYLYERKPGELWITTMQGGLRMKINTADLAQARFPVFVPPPKAQPKPGGIVMFGDSTTAPRGSVKVYATRVETALQSIGSSLSVFTTRASPATPRSRPANVFKKTCCGTNHASWSCSSASTTPPWMCGRKPPMTEPRVSLGGTSSTTTAP
jgi:hypothetical protein